MTDTPEQNQTCKPPAFQLYVRDWLVDTAYLTLEEQGAYLRLLCHQWIEGPLPNDRKALAQRLGLAAQRLSSFDKIWAALASHFPTLSGNGDSSHSTKIANSRLELVRAERVAFVQHQAQAGKRGADKRWGTKHGVAMTTPLGLPIPEHSSASASASASAKGSLVTESQLQVTAASPPPLKSVKQTSKQSTRTDAPAGQATSNTPWMTPFWDAWGRKVSKPVGKDASKSLAGQLSRYIHPLVEVYGSEHVARAWERYLGSERQGREKFLTPAKFAQTFDRWTGSLVDNAGIAPPGAPIRGRRE